MERISLPRRMFPQELDHELTARAQAEAEEEAADDLRGAIVVEC